MNQLALDKAVKYLKDWMQVQYEQQEIPGVVFAISYKGKLLLNEGYGFANLKDKVKMSPEHIFRVASQSKTFTATAVLQLQEQGKLHIDDPIAQHLNWLKDHKDKRWQKVTIRQVLSHGAGIIRDGKDKDYWYLSRVFPDKETLQKEFLKADLVLDNNTQMKYSNYGYSLLGMLIEAVSGQTYNDYVIKNIVEPLDLKNTGPEYTPKIENQIVTGYSRRLNGKRLVIDNADTRGMSPATGFYSAAADLCTYFSAHLIGSGKLLDDESKKEMQRTAWKAEHGTDGDEYGLGFVIEKANDHRVFGHGGGFPGHITKTYCDPANELVVVVLTNAIDAWASTLAKNALNAIYALQHYIPGKASPELEKYEGRFMSMFNDFDIVAVEGKCLVVDADDWEPFNDATEITPQGSDVFKITKANSFLSPGEEVRYIFSPAGNIEKVIYAGETCLPEEKYLEEMAGKERIALPSDS